MTEEIIIDGVNVAGCEHFDRDSSLNNCLAHCIPYPECTCYESCDEHPNCYYKQLKRLEQENKELKDELKPYKHPDVVTLLTNWRTGELDRIHNKIANERDTYRSALEEIRIYINKCRDSYCDSNCEYWDNCKGNYNINNILNKINECIGG